MTNAMLNTVEAQVEEYQKDMLSFCKSAVEDLCMRDGTIELSPELYGIDNNAKTIERNGLVCYLNEQGYCEGMTYSEEIEYVEGIMWTECAQEVASQGINPMSDGPIVTASAIRCLLIDDVLGDVEEWLTEQTGYTVVDD